MHFYFPWGMVPHKKQWANFSLCWLCAFPFFPCFADFSAYCIFSPDPLPQYNYKSKVKCPVNNIGTFYSYWYLPVFDIFLQNCSYFLPDLFAQISFCKSPGSHFIGENNRTKNRIFWGRDDVFNKVNLFDPPAGT